MKKNIGIIGGGNMGEALIKGLVGKIIMASGIFVCETDAKRKQYLKDKYHIGVGDLDAIVAQSSTVILAVKPQDMGNVLSQISATGNQLFISIAAGLTTPYFEKHLGGKPRVVRAMPNMPALIGEGITGICRGRWATASDLREAGRLLAAIGGVLEFQEKYMDALTAVSGSGPAYVFLFVEQWIVAAQALGFSEKEAKNLVYETLQGSAHLLKKTAFTAGALRAKVTSKGGTTEAAMKVFLKDNRFGKLMKEALTAASRRAGELAR